MKQTERSKKEPLFHIVKRDAIDTKTKAAFYAGAILLSLLLGGIICSLFSSGNPLMFFGSLFSGALSTSRRIWLLLQASSLHRNGRWCSASVR